MNLPQFSANSLPFEVCVLVQHSSKSSSVARRPIRWAVLGGSNHLSLDIRSHRATPIDLAFSSVERIVLESPTEAADCRIARDPGTLPRCAADRMLPAIYTSSGHVLVTSSLQRPSK